MTNNYTYSSCYVISKYNTNRNNYTNVIPIEYELKIIDGTLNAVRMKGRVPKCTK